MSVEALLKSIEETKKKAEAASNKDAIRKSAEDAAKKARRSSHRKGEFQDDDAAADEHDDAKETYIYKSASSFQGDEKMEIRDFQDWQDSVYILKSIMEVRRGYDPEWIRGTRLFQKGLRRHQRILKALDTTTSNRGTEWLPTEFSAQLKELVRNIGNVVPLFTDMDIPTKSFTMPVEKADLTIVKIAETTADDGTAISASQPTTTDVTFTATKVGRRVVLSDEIDEDSIVPMIPWVRRQSAIAMNAGMEDWLINGDDATNHQDNDVTAATDVRKIGDGLRLLALANASVDASNADPTDALLSSVITKMGKYGVNPSDMAVLCGPKGYAKLRAVTPVRTEEAYGTKATINTGRLTNYAGIPVVVSDKVREDLNASGVRDSTTQNRGVIIFAHLPSWMFAWRRRITVRTWEKVETEQIIMTVTGRLDIKKIYPAADTSEGILFNVKTT